MDGWSFVMPVSKDQATMLAAIAVACRPKGAPKWDAPGVVAAIGRVANLHLADVVHATIRAAEDASANTPGVIAATNSVHWRERVIGRPVAVEPFDPAATCGVCGQLAHRCRANPHNGHEFESVVEARRNQARASIRAASEGGSE
jgi:hypothetical protein